MSLGDSAFIFFLALLLFGPKKLPELARQLGKLMAEFRRASNEFKMQMEEELRVAEQEEQQKKIAAMQAAAPPTPALPGETSETTDGTTPVVTENTIAAPGGTDYDPPEIPHHMRDPEPIATSGDLKMMPPSTGLPIANESSASSVNEAFDAIPQDPEHAVVTTPHEIYDPSGGHTPDAPDHTTQHHAIDEAPIHG